MTDELDEASARADRPLPPIGPNDVPWEAYPDLPAFMRRIREDVNGLEDLDWWHVTPTGDPQTDFALGIHYGQTALAIAHRIRKADFVARVVDAMFAKGYFGHIEHGFFLRILQRAYANSFH
jgi:hypothetical protein